MEEYNKILENYGVLTKKLEEKEQTIKKQNEDHKEIETKLTQENQVKLLIFSPFKIFFLKKDLKKDLKQSQKNVKLFQLEKRKFMDEIQKVKTDLKVYENSAKSLKLCHLRLDCALKSQQDILKILRKDASKTLYSSISQIIQKSSSTLLQSTGNPKKPLNIEDLNNSRITIFSEKNPKQIKSKRSLSLSNKSQKSTKCQKNHNNINTSMFCEKKKKMASPLIKSQKNLFKTENSSNKKKSTPNYKTKDPSPYKFSPKRTEKNTQCFEPSWGNEKLCDIQNILKTATNQESERNPTADFKETGCINFKENSHNSSNRQNKSEKNFGEKKRMEKYKKKIRFNLMKSSIGWNIRN